MKKQLTVAAVQIREIASHFAEGGDTIALTVELRGMGFSSEQADDIIASGFVEADENDGGYMAIIEATKKFAIIIP